MSTVFSHILTNFSIRGVDQVLFLDFWEHPGSKSVSYVCKEVRMFKRCSPWSYNVAIHAFDPGYFSHLLAQFRSEHLMVLRVDSIHGPAPIFAWDFIGGTVKQTIRTCLYD